MDEGIISLKRTLPLTLSELQLHWASLLRGKIESNHSQGKAEPPDYITVGGSGGLLILKTDCSIQVWFWLRF